MATDTGGEGGGLLVMPFTDNVRPYASAGNITDLLERYRKLTLPTVLTSTDLSTLGIPAPNFSRTFAALRFLGLLTSDNAPTNEWRSLCALPEEDYKAQLAALIRHAYAEVFNRVDPASDPQQRIRNAFQPYEPRSQLDRMVTFFLAMCAYAGIETLETPRRRVTKSQAQTAKGRGVSDGRKTQTAATRGATQPAMGAVGTPPPSDGVSTLPPPPPTPDYSAISAVVNKLPRSGRWTENERKKWLTALTAVVDVEVQVQEALPAPAAEAIPATTNA